MHDFLNRSCIKLLKRTCKFILAFNYLLMHLKMNMLSECASQIKVFIKETCDLLINKLGEFQSDMDKYKHKLEKDK